MRGQVALELFFVFAFFMLLLFWLNNYYQTAQKTDIQDSQLSFVSTSLAATASKVCALKVSATWTAPCLYYGLGTTEQFEEWPYWITLEPGPTGKNNGIKASILEKSVTAYAACEYDSGSEGISTPLQPICNPDPAAGKETAGVYCVSIVEATAPGPDVLNKFKISEGECT